MKEVIRCLRCKLNQFETENGKCRRCQTPLDRHKYVIPLPVALIDAKYHFSIAKAVSESLFAYRHACGLTQMDIEHRINLMHCTTSRIEQGFRNPSLNVLERLADCLQIPITWLMQPVTNERIAELFAREVLLATRQVGVQLDAVRKLIALRERRAG